MYRKYDPAAVEKLKGVALPTKIKCNRCNRWMGHAQYSTKQLNDARIAVKSAHGRNATYSINCKNCTGAQIVELECTTCNKTKGLEEFAKCQRRKPDQAMCFKCSAAKEEQPAVDERVYESDDRAQLFAPNETAEGYNDENVWCAAGSEPSDAGDWEEVVSGGIGLSENFQQKLNMTSVDHERLIETEYDRTSEHGWRSAAAASWVSPSGTPSNKDSKTTGRAYSSSRAGQSDAEFKNGWAKIRAYDPKKDTSNSAAMPPEEEEEEWSSSDSDSDDDGSDDDDII